jgi:hypothetical protein
MKETFLKGIKVNYIPAQVAYIAFNICSIVYSFDAYSPT